MWCFFIASNLAFVPLLARPFAAKRAIDRLDMIARSIEKEAGRRGILADEDIQLIHDGIIRLAVVAPSIASGRLKLPDGKPSSEEEMQLRNFFDSNAWVLAYLTPAVLTLYQMEFLGQPYSPKTWYWAFIASILLRRMQADGTLIMSYSTRPAAREAAKVRIANDYIRTVPA
jgi:hypothetical protein